MIDSRTSGAPNVFGLDMPGTKMLSAIVHAPRNASRAIRRAVGLKRDQRGRLPVEASAADRALIEQYAPYTLTSRPCQWALLSALRYIDRQGIAGAIVECGVFRGGNMMLAKDEVRKHTLPRSLYLFDTFSGMTQPDPEKDVHSKGLSAIGTFDKKRRADGNDWCYASLPEVKSNFAKHMLGTEAVHFVQGPVEDTLLVESNLPDTIALLRLDTDWYASTKLELDVLYPRLARGGVLFVDDYGAWKGARSATDEFFGDRPPLLHVVDDGCRCTIKC